MENPFPISLPGQPSPAETPIAAQSSSINKSIIQFIWNEKTNRQYLWVALGGTLAQFIIFKFLYPFPDFFSDSYSYLFAAYAHLDVSIWPIGYSKFLAAFHHLTSSDLALVAFQYFFLELAALYFYFTILYFFRLGRPYRNILFALLFFSPMTLYICNYVNSDALFAAVSLFWFTELIWIVKRPGLYQVFTQAILVTVAFTIRNNAYYYPVLSVLAFAMSRQRPLVKWAGGILGLLLIGGFILHTREAAYQLTGTRQFSLFTGWQIANNALYTYDKVIVDSNDLPTPRAKLINRESIRFFNQVNKEQFNDFLYTNPGNFFIQFPASPLKTYLYKHYKFKDEYGSIVAWGMASADFAPFGNSIIKSHPLSFVRYFILPNASNYFIPPLEKLEKYNLGADSVEPMAVYWFHYSFPRVKAISKDFQASFLFLYPWLFLVGNLFIIGQLAWYWVKRRDMPDALLFNRPLILFAGFWLANLVFGIFATILVLRYEFAPMILIITIDLLLLERAENLSLIYKGSGNSGK